LLLAAVVAATLVYAFLNGMNDSGGLVAAAISSRSMGPRVALSVASLSEFAGPFLFGTAVAATIGRDLVQASAITLPILLVAIVSAIVWNTITWYFGLPSSSTHALLGGLAGAVGATQGIQALQLSGFAFVLLALFVAPILGLVAGFAFMRVTQYLIRNASPRVNVFFKRVQPLNVVALALSHGSNDGQKSMGLITLALVAASDQQGFAVPFWVTLVCATAMMLGVSIGGWRVIRTLGGRIYRLRPVHAFAAQSASALIVLGAALLGGPVSTTQVVSAAIIGVGSAERMNAVRWQVAGQIVTAWLVTIPASAFVAIFLHLLSVRIAGY
jgi:PiT family inorganic phosphate transporter